MDVCYKLVIKSAIVLIISLHSLITYAQSFEKDSIFLNKHILFLSSENMSGREGGSSDERLAAEYISSSLKSIGIKPFFCKSYLHKFSFTYDLQTFSSQNVAGFINNKADSTIIIISHYDHIGNGGKLSKSYGKIEIHPGADDNCSGVAANLLLAQKIIESKNKEFNYLFLFTGAHEKGLFGAQELFEVRRFTNLKISLVINFDMIGRLDETTNMMIFETQNFELSPDILTKYSENSIEFQNKKNLVGDQTKFAEKDFKTLIISTGIHDDYHKISDTAEKINYRGLVNIVETIDNFLTH